MGGPGQIARAAGVALAAGVAAALGLGGPAPRPAGGRSAAASTPAATTYPSADCIRQTHDAANQIRKRLDASFNVVIRPPFAVIGNVPPAGLRAMATASVGESAALLWGSYFTARPTRPITALLFADEKSYRHWAEKLFGDTDVSYYGYYKHDGRTLVMNISTGTGTLVHELTHALIASDWPGVPDWFNEGLASLHEQCRRGQGELVGLVNWRLPALQKAIQAGTLRPLAQLVTRADFYGQLSALNYAQTRYFVMYTQQRGLLRSFYRYYRDHSAGPDAAVKAIEAVFGKTLPVVEQDFLKWVRPLRWPED